jgi:hypothetical protein
MKGLRIKSFIVSLVVLCTVFFISPSWSQDGSNSTTTPVRDPVTAVGKITSHAYDGDGSRHSIIAMRLDKNPKKPVTIEFGRLEPVLVVGSRYSFSYKPVLSDSGDAVTLNGRQIFELDEQSVVLDPEQ